MTPINDTDINSMIPMVNYWPVSPQNYLDSFGFLDAALDQAIIDNSMENDADGISMRANPVNAKNIHGKLI